MTKSDQRIAVAEFCGFVWYRIPNPRNDDRVYRMLAHPAIHEYGEQSPEWLVRADGTEGICNWEYMSREGHVPDYTNDLNDIHDAEEQLLRTSQDATTDELWAKFSWNLVNVCGGTSIFFHATASQRCEALLKTIGKWI